MHSCCIRVVSRPRLLQSIFLRHTWDSRRHPDSQNKFQCCSLCNCKSRSDPIWKSISLPDTWYTQQLMGPRPLQSMSLFYNARTVADLLHPQTANICRPRNLNTLMSQPGAHISLQRSSGKLHFQYEP